MSVWDDLKKLAGVPLPGYGYSDTAARTATAENEARMAARLAAAGHSVTIAQVNPGEQLTMEMIKKALAILRVNEIMPPHLLPGGGDEPGYEEEVVLTPKSHCVPACSPPEHAVRAAGDITYEIKWRDKTYGTKKHEKWESISSEKATAMLKRRFPDPAALEITQLKLRRGTEIVTDNYVIRGIVEPLDLWDLYEHIEDIPD